MRNKKNITWLALSVLIVVLSIHAKEMEQDSQVVSVLAERVKVQQISKSLSLIGRLESNESVVIASEVIGKVDKIVVSANQVVKHGKLLIQLDDNKAQALVDEAQAYLNNQKRIFNELEELVKKGAVPKTEIDAQKASLEIAVARLSIAKANLNKLYMVAPFSGTVGFVDLNRGQLVSVGDRLLTLDNLSIMKLDLEVPEVYLSMISAGMKVSAKTAAWGDTEFFGEVVGIDSHMNRDTLSFRVRVLFKNSSKKLKPGMLISANIIFSPMQVSIIPVQSIEYSGNKRFVYVISQDSKVIRTEVILGSHIGNSIVVERGLEIGQKVVVQGTVNMRDGISVSELNEYNLQEKKEVD
ncbi:membrane protein [Candidatus Photodesmus blepharus]|uniref:Membrane protein n=1 Tax=Candidatus Photodesmus blepharonis TaxID=1179155 RepID=A0A084CPI4_9GAMM|nr:efflux RND transporter periplasmic adaptor subunit [Candidatus Photodesmus blepharus]KEY91713.1 membrane protein [Candidatus Photodesmus blepharus]